MRRHTVVLRNRRYAVLLALLLALVPVRGGRAQAGFDPEAVALTYYKVTGDPIDLHGVASRSPAATRASNFDRPAAIARELARLEAALASSDPVTEFTVTVDDSISEYDHASSEFSITLFTPGYYLPVQAFGQDYRIVFANASAARAIHVETDAARELDGRLDTFGRRVKNEIRFKVIGKGDAAGAVSGSLVIRAEITSARVLDQAGRVLFMPDVATPVASPAVDRIDPSKTDVAGLRVGTRSRDMEATLERLFGSVSRGKTSSGTFGGFVGTLEVNTTGCFSIPGRRSNPTPGAVCVTAYLDGDTVRMIRIQRLFPPNFDADVFRRGLLQKYGPASGALPNGISWGPGVPGAVLNNPSVSAHALTATFAADTDFMSAALNQRENVIVTLQLVDAAWATSVAQGSRQ
jgi:hypothetical protein